MSQVIKPLVYGRQTLYQVVAAFLANQVASSAEICDDNLKSRIAASDECPELILNGYLVAWKSYYLKDTIVILARTRDPKTNTEHDMYEEVLALLSKLTKRRKLNLHII